jgi:transposase
MKRDGRGLAHNTLEEMHILAVQRMAEGEHPDDVAGSFGMHRSWAYKIRAQARGRGRGVRVLLWTKGTGRPRKLTQAQERQASSRLRKKRQAWRTGRTGACRP